ncbi:MAG: CBS domain-containing protein [Calditrichaeota bacterium]|nr:MAG: CBS domain-containing protein [Calditrichota bacterium]
MKTAREMLLEKGNEIIAVSPDATLYDAIQVMIDHNIGAVLIKDGEKITGIWTERDLVRNSVQAGFNPKTAKIGDYMVTNLKKTSGDTTCMAMMDKFLGMRLRHLLVEEQGKITGLISIGDVIKGSLMEKTAELEALNKMVKWDYYENWRWKRKD